MVGATLFDTQIRVLGLKGCVDILVVFAVVIVCMEGV